MPPAWNDLFALAWPGTLELTRCRCRTRLGWAGSGIENADGHHQIDDRRCGLRRNAARPTRQNLAPCRRRAGVVEEGGERDPAEIGNRMLELGMAERPRPTD